MPMAEPAADLGVELPYPAADLLHVGDLGIVRVAPPEGVVYNRNVFAVNGDGGLVWQIQESPHGTQDDKPYTAIWIGADGRLMAGSWNGVDYEVSLVDGTVSPCAFPK
ncbi:MAG: hypothetical protein QM774_06735 [Gordonia sp. (in: high G+C Gram-positive bacteria)]|uniref:hypothetical protein n=1 Tax=Gordonia sp. (in: high G+C Gram-positive bacteria) TaxID=84139 RepID=UPI0039E5DDAA